MQQLRLPLFDFLAPNQAVCELCAEPFTQRSKYYSARFCSIQCRNRANARQQVAVKGVRCPGCGYYGYRRTPLCQACGGIPVRSCPLWTVDEIEILTRRYAEEGCETLALALGKTPLQVRDKAAKLKLRLTAEARTRIIYGPSQVRMRRANPMKRPEVRAKRHEWDQAHPEQAAATRRALLEGHQRLERSKPSNLEHRLRGYLDDLGISYEPAAMIKPGFIVDIRIGRLILQADGDYWHGHLRFEPLTERQQKQRSRDKAQDAYLRACGYAVVRIWECEMSFDLVRRILEEHAILPAEASA